MTVAPPLTAGQGRTLSTAGLLADDVAGLTKAWGRLQNQWTETVVGVRRELAESRLGERVNGEWSFIETLRHLIFVTDAWIGTGLVDSQTYHPLGLPPHFVTNGLELGLDLDAKPGLDAVLEARQSRRRTMERALSIMADDQLDRPCLGRLADFTRRGAVQVVVAEECFHHGFAVRDLSALRSQ